MQDQVMDEIIDRIIYLTEQQQFEFMNEIHEINKKYPTGAFLYPKLEKFEEVFYKRLESNEKLRLAMDAALAAINKYRNIKNILAEIRMEKERYGRNTAIQQDSVSVSVSSKAYWGGDKIGD
jgi:hypothetical protein